jgi:hypothetical protein
MGECALQGFAKQCVNGIVLYVISKVAAQLGCDDGEGTKETGAIKLAGR